MMETENITKDLDPMETKNTAGTKKAKDRATKKEFSTEEKIDYSRKKARDWAERAFRERIIFDPAFPEKEPSEEQIKQLAEAIFHWQRTYHYFDPTAGDDGTGKDVFYEVTEIAFDISKRYKIFCDGTNDAVFDTVTGKSSPLKGFDIFKDRIEFPIYVYDGNNKKSNINDTNRVLRNCPFVFYYEGGIIFEPYGYSQWCSNEHCKMGITKNYGFNAFNTFKHRYSEFEQLESKIASLPKETNDKFIYYQDTLINRLIGAKTTYRDHKVHLLWSFVRQIFIDPKEKPDICFVFRTSEGAGKDTFADLIGDLLGQPITKLTHKEFESNFNSYQERALLIVLNEDVPKELSHIKKMTGQKHISTEKKGRDRELAVPNYTRLFAFTNDGKMERIISNDGRRCVYCESDATSDPDFFMEFARLKNDPLFLAHFFHRIIRHDPGDYTGHSDLIILKDNRERALKFRNECEIVRYVSALYEDLNQEGKPGMEGYSMLWDVRTRHDGERKESPTEQRTAMINLIGDQTGARALFNKMFPQRTRDEKGCFSGVIINNEEFSLGNSAKIGFRDLLFRTERYTPTKQNPKGKPKEIYGRSSEEVFFILEGKGDEIKQRIALLESTKGKITEN